MLRNAALLSDFGFLLESIVVMFSLFILFFAFILILTESRVFLLYFEPFVDSPVVPDFTGPVLEAVRHTALPPQPKEGVLSSLLHPPRR